MMDRVARSEAAAAIEAFLDDRITAFEFDERMQAIETNDRTVREVVEAVWYHYDDCRDHQVVLTKPEWDYFQRLLLLLRSRAEVMTTVTRRWSWDHGLAWLALAVFIGLGCTLGWGVELVALVIPFGMLSMAISWFRGRRTSGGLVHDLGCMPFASYSQIRWLLRRTPGFSKRRYRRELEQRQIRGTLQGQGVEMAGNLSWLLLSPFALLVQGFPSPASAVVDVSVPGKADAVSGRLT